LYVSIQSPLVYILKLTASQVAPSPAGEGWGEENKIKAFLISPSSNLLPLEKAFAER